MQGIPAMTKGREGQTPLNFFVPTDLHSRLREAAGERGLSEFVRRAVEVALDHGARRDPRVQEVLDQIGRAADALTDLHDPSSQFYYEVLSQVAVKLIAFVGSRAGEERKATDQGKALFEDPFDVGEVGAWVAGYAIGAGLKFR